MAESTGRFHYDDESAGSGNLWLAALVVAAMVAAFLVGKYVIGERLKGGGPEMTAAPPAVSGTLAPASPNALATITPGGDAAGTSPGSLEAGVNNLKSGADPSLATAPPTTAAQPDTTAGATAPTTTITPSTAEAKPKPAAKHTTSSSTETQSTDAHGGYDKAQPDKPYKPGADSSAAKSDSGSGGSTSGAYRVQVGSFDSKAAAEKRRRELLDDGHQVSIKTRKIDGKTVYQLSAGTYMDRKRAQQEAAKLEKDGVDATVEH
jgi:cell division protein FtsN